MAAEGVRRAVLAGHLVPPPGVPEQGKALAWSPAGWTYTAVAAPDLSGFATTAALSALSATVAGKASQAALDVEVATRGAADALLAPQAALDAEAASRIAGDAGAVRLAPAGAQVVVSPAAGVVPFSVQAAVSQNVDMQRWQDSGAAVKSSVNAFGSMLLRTTTQFGTAALSVQTPAVGSEGAVIRALASQTADLLQVQNGSAATIMRVSSGGAITTASDLAVGTATTGTARALIVGGSAALPALIARAAAAQSADVARFESSAGSGLLVVQSSGYVQASQGMTINNNLRLGLVSGQADSGGGSGVVALANAITVPAVSPVGGGVLYSEAGALKWKGSADTVTVIAPA